MQVLMNIQLLVLVALLCIAVILFLAVRDESKRLKTYNQSVEAQAKKTKKGKTSNVTTRSK